MLISQEKTGNNEACGRKSRNLISPDRAGDIRVCWGGRLVVMWAKRAGAALE